MAYQSLWASKSRAILVVAERLSDAAVDEAEADSDILVLIVIGEGGRAFSAGADLKQMSALDAKGEASKFMASVRSDKLASCSKPVIAAIDGYCLAGGTDLALSCDMIIAAENAKIGFPATRANGTPPSNWWIYHMGPQWAKRMLATGDMLWGRDAAKLGLVLDAVPVEKLEEAVMSLAKRMSFVDTEMLSTHKRIVNLAMEVMGANTMQRLAVEMDARSHLVTGPMRTAFKKDMAEGGLKQALKNRDRPFGDGMVRLGEPQQTFD